jgi:CcmD family protein
MVISYRSRAALAWALIVGSLVFLSQPTALVYAQPPRGEVSTQTSDGNDRTAFRPVQAADRDRAPGGLLLLVAYGLVWLLLLVYVVHIGRLQAKTQSELERLERTLSEIESPDQARGDKSQNRRQLE